MPEGADVDKAGVGCIIDSLARVTCNFWPWTLIFYNPNQPRPASAGSNSGSTTGNFVLASQNGPAFQAPVIRLFRARPRNPVKSGKTPWVFTEPSGIVRTARTTAGPQASGSDRRDVCTEAKGSAGVDRVLNSGVPQQVAYHRSSPRGESLATPNWSAPVSITTRSGLVWIRSTPASWSASIP